MRRKGYERYIVSDPKICHGALTFKDTRILAPVVLNMIAGGMDWNETCREFSNWITRDLIAEAVQLAKEVLERSMDRRRAKVTEAKVA